MRAPAAAVAAIALIVLTLIVPRAGAAPTVKTSLTAVEGTYMCVLCHEPLALAQSPQATTERETIQRLAGLGETPAQIKTQMVTIFGQGVLALPPAHGFNLVVYVIPPLLVLLAILFLVYTLPKWRTRAREIDSTPYSTARDLSTADADRLAADLAQFD